MYAPKSTGLKIAVANHITLIDHKRDRQLPLKIYYSHRKPPGNPVAFSAGRDRRASEEFHPRLIQQTKFLAGSGVGDE